MATNKEKKNSALVTLELTTVEASAILEMMRLFHWSGKNLDETMRNVAIALSIKGKLENALHGRK